jgi:PhzF family phenazine biosynthesis protein
MENNQRALGHLTRRHAVKKMNMERHMIYQVDAFTDKVFGGNPAAVCILDSWLDDKTMQQIAAENNLAETAFVVKSKYDFEIRWFTPEVEVDLCGHATLAAAHVLFEYYKCESQMINFITRTSGLLSVEKKATHLTMDFPTDVYKEIEIPMEIINAIGSTPIEAYKGKTDYLLIFSSQQEIESIQPDFQLLSNVDGRGVIVSSVGTDTDFVSRFFAPQVGINEDPVTGSAHTTLTPVWSEKLEKKRLTAKQLSKRGGDLLCELKGDRVLISGEAITYLKGEIQI